MQLDDFQDREGSWVNTVYSRGRKHETRSARVYNAMQERCKPGFWATDPAYAGCSSTFETYQHFAVWYTQQPCVALACGEIDKDLLVPGNRVYSPETCVVIPREINLFLTDKGGMQTGVRQRRQRFGARITRHSKEIHLGTFDTLEEATAAYRAAKIEHAAVLAEKYKSHLCQRAYSALQNYENLHLKG